MAAREPAQAACAAPARQPRRRRAGMVAALSILSLGLGLAAPAAAVEHIWEGEMMVVSASPACGATVQTGNALASVLRPRAIGTNGNDTLLNFVSASAAVSHQFVNAGLNTTTGVDQPYTATSIRRNGLVIAYTIANGLIGGRTTPLVIRATSKYVFVKGLLIRFDNVAGCNVSFRAVYVKRP